MYSQTQTGRFEMEYTSGNKVIPVSFYVPEDYDSTKQYPFIYGWHGNQMPSTNMCDMLYSVIAKNEKAIVCCPDINSILSDGNMIGQVINGSLTYCFSTFKIDTSKTIISGFSLGGNIAYSVGLYSTEYFKGIITISPAINMSSYDQTMWDNVTKIRMATIEGDKDVNFDGVDSVMKEMLSKNANLLYLVKPGVQHLDPTYHQSQEFAQDYKKCYDYVLNTTSSIEINEDKSSNIKIVINSSNNNSLLLSSDSEIEKVTISDILGKTIYSSNPNSTSQEIDLDRGGLYFVNVKSKTESLTKKILLNK